MQHALLREEIFFYGSSPIFDGFETAVLTPIFFHAMIRKKRQLFHIHRIQNDSFFDWISKPSAADSAVDYFQELLVGGASQFQQMDFDFIPSLVSAEDDVGLCRESNMDEVRRVIFSIDPDSALGPDGFCSRFYQSCWDIICCDLLDVVLDYFRSLAMPRGFQSTLFVLLPKKVSPASWADF